MMLFVVTVAQQRQDGQRVATAVLAVFDVVDRQEPRRLAPRHGAAKFVAHEDLPSRRRRDRRCDSGRFVALEIADVLAVAGDALDVLRQPTV